MSVDPTFSALGTPKPLVSVLERARITTPTPVQLAVIPDAIAGRDVLGRAATGSGKTLAFGIPVIARLAGRRSKPKAPRGLIVVPTRELAMQVRQSLDPLADAQGLRLVTVYGGTPYDRQIKRLRAGADIIVATPGRLKDLIERGSCTLERVEIAVLDEADHLCDLGFFPAVSELLSLTKPGGQRMLLSATLDGDVDRLVRAHLADPITHICNPDDDKLDIDHHVLVARPDNKLDAAVSLLLANPRSIVFTRTRMGATRLASDLAARGVTTVDLHGALTQGARERNLRKFRTGQADVIVATDVAARGIHVDGISVVVHYDAPTEQKAYLHRSGRTARAGASGTVVTMTTSRQLSALSRLHKAAGVTARHHDARSAPDPMTAAALAKSGGVAATAEPTAATTRHGDQGQRRPRVHGRRAQTRQAVARRSETRQPQRTSSGRRQSPPVAPAHTKPGKPGKQRWTKAQREASSRG